MRDADYSAQKISALPALLLSLALLLFVLTVARAAANARRIGAAAVASERIFVGANIPDPVLRTFERSCQDCHSLKTKWPWYAKIPPISHKMRRDVTQARAFMNLSKWNTYSNTQKRGYLAAIRAVISARIMPPSRYLWLHPRAKLSKTEIRALTAWPSRSNGGCETHGASLRKQGRGTRGGSAGA